MKPRTKLQFEVLENTKHLPYVRNKVYDWAKVECMKHLGYATKNRVICMDCGERFPTSLVSRKRACCPHCNTKLTITPTRDRTLKQDVYVAIAQTYYEFQVIRLFEIQSTHKSERKTAYSFFEVLQHWILPNGKREVIARNHTSNWCCDSWNGNMEIRNKSDVNKYDIYHSAFHPESEFKPEYLKIGINHKLQGITALEAIKHIPTDSRAETLLKAKQYDLLYARIQNKWEVENKWQSIKICMRNNYIVKDAKIWFDYLDLLRYFKKDLHSAHYICPKDLKKQHDIYVKRKKKVMQVEEMKHDYVRILKYLGEFDATNFSYPKDWVKQYRILVDRKKVVELERKQKMLDEMKVKYEQFIQHFIDIQIQDKLIRIVPLQTIDEFKEEGNELHHCVYSNEYFKYHDKLILSARIEDKRLATIEINLNNMKIVQCRGDHNTVPKHYERIQRLINRNIKQIKERFKLNQSA